MSGVLAPRVRDAIRDRFDHIFPRLAPYPSGSAASIQQHHALRLNEATEVYHSILDCAKSLYSVMRFRLSACARINQLPDDVLVHIMSTMSLPELITATHVCHRWRRLGVETPALWTQITMTSQGADVSDIILARSKAASLDLVINTFPRGLGGPRDDTLLTGPHMERVRSLTLSDSDRRPIFFDTLFMSPTPPSAQNYGTAAPLCAAPRLERLRIDQNPAWGSHADYTFPFDCSALQEAYIIRGPANVDFLSGCTHLRVLVLHIPDAITGPDVLRVMHANPELRTVELYIPPAWERTVGAWESSDALLAPNQIEHLTIRLKSPGRLSAGLDDATRALISWFNCPRIPMVEVPCHFREAEDAVGYWLLDHLEIATSAIIGYDTLRLEDAGGYVRCFTNVTASRPLQLAIPFLGRARTCGAHLSQWATLSDYELPFLEGLNLRCEIEDLVASYHGGPACPALHDFTLVQSWHEAAPPGIGLDVATVVEAVSSAVLRNCPPVQSFTVVRARDVNSAPLEDQTVHFDPPLHPTVFVTSTISDRPRAPPQPPASFDLSLADAGPGLYALLADAFPQDVPWPFGPPSDA